MQSQEYYSENTVACPKCGMRVNVSDMICPRDGTLILLDSTRDEKFENNYEFCERIAAGGMGVIFKARHRVLDTFVAVKMMHTTAATTVSVRRFQQEARTLAKLMHPNLVRLFELGITSSGMPYTVMEFVDGRGLDSLLKERGRLMLPNALNIFSQVCDGLAYVHRQGILHRDMKPSNIMIEHSASDSPKVKLVDFGVAKIIDETAAKSLTQTGEVIGSPLYMSPEQAKGLALDQRSDIYSLGCVFYEMLTGYPPFNARSAVELIMKQVSEPPKSINSVVAGQKFPNTVESLVGKMLEKTRRTGFNPLKKFKKNWPK